MEMRLHIVKRDNTKYIVDTSSFAPPLNAAIAVAATEEDPSTETEISPNNCPASAADKPRPVNAAAIPMV
jgi:hypothetical protein